jgi:ATP-dependent Clp protease ATP-binding subunit ClpA
VRQQVEERVGQGRVAPTGHIPFKPRAKKALELALREALQLGHNYIGTEHILLGLIREGDDVAAQVLQNLGADLNRVRQQVVALLAGYASSPSAEEVPLQETGGEANPSRPVSPRCPRCRRWLADTIQYETQPVKQRDGEGTRDVVVVFCGRCGNALGAF